MNDLSETARLIETAAAAAPAVAAGSTAADKSWTASLSDFYVALSRWWSRQPLTRFIRRSLGRRILVSNLLGLFGLLLGMLYLSLSHAWLLDAKVEVVRTLSRVTAEAIAYKASNDNRGPLADAAQLSGSGATARVRRDDAFAALELPISPERATPILKKLIQPTDLIARIYSPKGTLIVDSDTLFDKGNKQVPEAGAQTTDDAPRLKNFWTRFHYWLNNKELKVYRELGTANGFLYPEVKKAAEEGIETPILLLDSKGQQIVSIAAPVKRGNRILAVLLLMTRPGEIDATLWDERLLIIQIAAIAFIASVISSLLLVRAVAGPMKRLSEAADKVSQNMRADVPDFLERKDEVGQMGRAFKAMTAALYRRIDASEKFAADVAHELKNPLAAARSTAEALTYARTEEDRTELVKEIQNELKRLNQLINDVSHASRLDAELARQQMQRTSVRAVLDNVSGIFRDLLTDDTRKIALQIDKGMTEAQLVVNGNEGRLGQVFTNLIDNALSFSPEGATVTLIARPHNGGIEVAVEDEGPGIPDDRLGTIFERFYSDRPATDNKRGKNSGLGLSISREIVASHRGEIFAENRRDADGNKTGARFVVRLPAMPPAGGLIAR